jgi:hypothetical protein
MPPNESDALQSWQEEYDRLKIVLAQTGWISEGYVQDRGPGVGGPCYPWTHKVKGKTVSVASSKEQYDWLKSGHHQLAQRPSGAATNAATHPPSALQHRAGHLASQPSQ